MLHVLLLYDEKRLLPDQDELNQVALQHGFEVHRYDLRESAQSVGAFLSTITDRKMPVLWVVFLYAYHTTSQDLEAALTRHVGSPLLIPLLLGTDQVTRLFSREFQHWWQGQWQIVLEQSGSSFEQFWNSPSASAGILPMPFKPARDFDGFLFPWLKLWDADLGAAQFAETSAESRPGKRAAHRVSPVRKSLHLRLVSLIAGVVVVAIMLAWRFGRLLEAGVVLVAIAVACGVLLLARGVLTSLRGARGANNHSVRFRLMTRLLVLVILAVSGALALAAFARFTETPSLAPISTDTPVSTALTQPGDMLSLSPAPTRSRSTVTATPLTPRPTRTPPITSTTMTASAAQPEVSVTSTYAGIAPTNTRKPTEPGDS